MLMCCSKYFGDTTKVYLEHKKGCIEYGICPVCKTLRVFVDGKYIKKRKAQSFLNEVLSQRHWEMPNLKVKYGSRQNMFWFFNDRGTKRDFNGENRGNVKTEIYNIIADTDSTDFKVLFS